MQDLQITYEGDFDLYVLWLFDKELISLLVRQVSTYDSMVHKQSYKISYSPLDGLHSF